MDDDIPELEDLPTQPKSQNTYIGDYTVEKQEILINQVEPNKPQSESGLKKGFFNTSQTPKQEEVIHIKANTNKQNPLQIDEVQSNMKRSGASDIGKFLTQNKDQWLNKDLLNKIASNPKLQKLFTNPEYLQAVQQMQQSPQQVMAKYANNKEFIELLQEYMKTMGEHFQEIAPKKSQTQEEKIQEIIETDPEVKEILQDQKVQAFIQYIQKQGKVDFQELAYKDPQLTKKLQILISKGIFNLQRE